MTQQRRPDRRLAGRGGDIDHGFYIAEHCLRLPGLELDTAYTAVVSGDGHLRSHAGGADTVHFNSDGAPRHPDLELQPVGQNLLLASVPHTRRMRPSRLRAFLVPFDAVSGPARPPKRRATTSLRSPRSTTSPCRRRRAAPAQHHEREHREVVHLLPRPGGRDPADVRPLVPGRRRPDLGERQRDVRGVRDRPDRRPVPALARVQRLHPARRSHGRPRSDASSTPEGTMCSRFELEQRRSDLPRNLCHPDSVATGWCREHRHDGSERLADRGFNGDLVVRVDATLSSGETSETTYVLPAGSGSCVGVCSAPGPSEFAVATIGGTMHLTQTLGRRPAERRRLRVADLGRDREPDRLRRTRRPADRP